MSIQRASVSNSCLLQSGYLPQAGNWYSELIKLWAARSTVYTKYGKYYCLFQLWDSTSQANSYDNASAIITFVLTYSIIKCVAHTTRTLDVLLLQRMTATGTSLPGCTPFHRQFVIGRILAITCLKIYLCMFVFLIICICLFN